MSIHWKNLDRTLNHSNHTSLFAGLLNAKTKKPFVEIAKSWYPYVFYSFCHLMFYGGSYAWSSV